MQVRLTFISVVSEILGTFVCPWVREPPHIRRRILLRPPGRKEGRTYCVGPLEGLVDSGQLCGCDHMTSARFKVVFQIWKILLIVVREGMAQEFLISGKCRVGFILRHLRRFSKN